MRQGQSPLFGRIAQGSAAAALSAGKASGYPAVGADDSVRPPEVSLSPEGQLVAQCWAEISSLYGNTVIADKSVIMPNHFHGIIMIDHNDGERRPTLSKIVQGFKSVTTRRCFEFGHQTIWQRGFYEHIIRNDRDYLEIWQYIDDNPAKWGEDEYNLP